MPKKPKQDQLPLDEPDWKIDEETREEGRAYLPLIREALKRGTDQGHEQLHPVEEEEGEVGESDEG